MEFSEGQSHGAIGMAQTHTSICCYELIWVLMGDFEIQLTIRVWKGSTIGSLGDKQKMLASVV